MAVVVVVVMVLTVKSMTCLWRYATTVKHLIMGAVSLWTRPPALHLCAGPLKNTPSAHHRDDELPRVSMPTGMPTTCRCKNSATSQHAHLQRHNRDIDHQMYGNWEISMEF